MPQIPEKVASDPTLARRRSSGVGPASLVHLQSPPHAGRGLAGPLYRGGPRALGHQPRGGPCTGLGLDGYVEAGWPANRQPAAPVCRAGGGVEPQPHRAPGARHRAGPGRQGARPLPGAVGHWTPSVAS